MRNRDDIAAQSLSTFSPVFVATRSDPTNRKLDILPKPLHRSSLDGASASHGTRNRANHSKSVLLCPTHHAPRPRSFATVDARFWTAVQ